MIHTTLSAIRAASPCREGWEKLVNSLGGINAYDAEAPLSVAHVLDSNGLDDTLWVLANACGEEGRKLCVTFACDVAERALAIFEKHYPNDDRPRKAIEAARNWAANPTDAAAHAVHAAAHAADAAADAAAYAAHAAARAAAYAARAAAYAAYAAYAARAAAHAAAYADAAAYAAEREWQVSRLRELLD